MGLSKEERNEIEGLDLNAPPPVIDDKRELAFSRSRRSRAAVDLAFDPPSKVAELQERTMHWLMRPYPLGLRFSGINMDPLPCWLAGTHYVCLNMCQNDVPVQLHHTLFNGTGGYVLKPLEMRTGVPWPPPRDSLRRVTIEVLSLHNLPKRGERRPRLEGSRGDCHKYFPEELSGIRALPDASEPSTAGVEFSVHSIGGFCSIRSTATADPRGSDEPPPAVSRAASLSSLPVEQTMDQWSPRATATKNGLNATFAQATLHCLASEPNETFLRVVALDGKEAVAYETAVLGRLRRGYRVFQLRSELGTRIEQCYLLVKISFGREPNQWPAPSQRLDQARELAELRSRTEAQSRRITILERAASTSFDITKLGDLTTASRI